MLLQRGTAALPLCLLFAAPASATTLKLDPTRSQVTLSGKVVGNTLREQAPGSLTTTVGGTIDVTVQGGQIQINSAVLDPNTNGNWAPGRNAQTSPADFGGQASSIIGSIIGALRDLVVDASSPPRSIAANGEFDASAIIFAFPANSTSVLDYDSFLGKDSKKLAGAGTNQTATVGTLIESNGVQTLTLAIDATFFFSLLTQNDSPLTLKGQLVADNAPSSSLAVITKIEIANNEVRVTVTGTGPASRLQSSTDLLVWTLSNATVVDTNGTTRTFAVPLSGRQQFFRLAD